MDTSIWHPQMQFSWIWFLWSSRCSFRSQAWMISCWVSSTFLIHPYSQVWKIKLQVEVAGAASLVWKMQLGQGSFWSLARIFDWELHFTWSYGRGIGAGFLRSILQLLPKDQNNSPGIWWHVLLESQCPGCGCWYGIDAEAAGTPVSSCCGNSLGSNWLRAWRFSDGPR